MQIIFCHHAHRDKSKGLNENDGLTKIGVKDAKNTAKLLSEAHKIRPINAIYSAPLFRCTKTAEIINKYIKLPIFTDERLNEQDFKNNESWLDTQNRVREFLLEIIKKHDENDIVVCVTSGINVMAFIQLALNIPASPDAYKIGVPSCSPLVFNYKKADFE